MTVALPLTPADRFAYVLKGLREVVADRGGRRLITGTLVLLIWTRLGRIAEKFAVLTERVRAGTLPVSAPARTPRTASAPSSPRLLRPRREDEMPTGFGWLIRLGGHHAAGFGSQLQHLLCDPEMVALISAAPGPMGRLLRPLCWMLGIKPSPGLFPNRARKPKSADASGISGGTEEKKPRAPRPKRRRRLREGERMTAAFIRSLSVPWRD